MAEMVLTFQAAHHTVPPPMLERDDLPETLRDLAFRLLAPEREQRKRRSFGLSDAQSVACMPRCITVASPAGWMTTSSSR